jgi:hypothetical protein
MASLRAFANTAVFLAPAEAFTDDYPGTTYRGAPFELSNLGSLVPVDVGQFQIDVLGDDGISGFYMLSRSSSVTTEARRFFPRIGIPISPEGGTSARGLLPEKPAQFIGSGLIYAPSGDVQSQMDVSVLYRLHYQDALLVTFCVDFRDQPDFALRVIFRFYSTLRV